jgi:hypothetical protein
MFWVIYLCFPQQNKTIDTGNGSYVNRFLVPCVAESGNSLHLSLETLLLILCDSEECVMTQMAHLLLRFFYKLWFFGAAYYWMSWAFLVVCAIIASILCIQGYLFTGCPAWLSCVSHQETSLIDRRRSGRGRFH